MKNTITLELSDATIGAHARAIAKHLQSYGTLGFVIAEFALTEMAKIDNVAILKFNNTLLADTPGYIEAQKREEERDDAREFEKYERGEWHDAEARERHITRTGAR